MNSILVVRGGAIGDFVLTLPVLSALRKNYAGSQIELLANPAQGALAIEFGFADNVRDLGSSSFAPLFAPGGPCSAELASWLRGFDLIVSYVYDPEHIFEKNVCSVSNARFVTGPHRPDEQSDVHATDQLFRPIQSLLPQPRDVGSWTLNVGRSPSNTLAIHPGSGSDQKNWPEENWRALLKHLVDSTDLSFLIVGGEAERERLPEFAKVVPSPRRELALDLPLVEVSRRLTNCRAFIGHDSGITHLAAVLGLPCVILWGPTKHETWQPLGDKSTLLRHPDGLRFLPVSAVVNTLNSLLQRQ